MAPMTALHPDPQNANQHTQRGQRIVTESMQKNKFGRPGLAAKDGEVLAGNLSVTEVAADLGAEEVILVYTDGSRPIVHVRTDVEPGSPEAVALALADNRASEVSLNWSTDILEAIREKEPDLVNGLWTAVEQVEEKAKGLQVPYVDMDEGTKSVGFGRLQTSQSQIVAGFGRFSALAPGPLVMAIIEKMKEHWGDDPDVAIPEFCQSLLVDFLGGELPPEQEPKK